jgi:hypothetical protein
MDFEDTADEAPYTRVMQDEMASVLKRIEQAQEDKSAIEGRLAALAQHVATATSIHDECPAVVEQLDGELDDAKTALLDAYTNLCCERDTLISQLQASDEALRREQVEHSETKTQHSVAKRELSEHMAQLSSSAIVLNASKKELAAVRRQQQEQIAQSQREQLALADEKRRVEQLQARLDAERIDQHQRVALLKEREAQLQSQLDADRINQQQRVALLKEREAQLQSQLDADRINQHQRVALLEDTVLDAHAQLATSEAELAAQERRWRSDEAVLQAELRSSEACCSALTSAATGAEQLTNLAVATLCIELAAEEGARASAEDAMSALQCDMSQKQRASVDQLKPASEQELVPPLDKLEGMEDAEESRQVAALSTSEAHARLPRHTPQSTNDVSPSLLEAAKACGMDSVLSFLNPLSDRKSPFVLATAKPTTTPEEHTTGSAGSPFEDQGRISRPSTVQKGTKRRRAVAPSTANGAAHLSTRRRPKPAPYDLFS